jgi:uncharacterized protein YqhQ
VSIGRFLRLAAHLQMLPILEGGEETLIGGQAVMDGVMMLAPHSYCVAVRKPDGQIVTQEAPVQKISDKYPIFKYPLIRGLGRIGQTMQLGSRALKFSFNTLFEEEMKGQSAEESGWMITGGAVLGAVIFVGLFLAIPMLAAKGLGTHAPILASRFAMNLVEGVIRMAIFLAYLFLLSRPEDIQRVFRYHGAEHKVVFNYESGKPVTVENAQKFVTFHPRCGTCFLLVLLVVSIFVHALIPFDNLALKLLARIAVLPLVIGLSYEVIRFAAKRQGTLMGMITRPGLWLQRITTKQPTDDQAAVAIHALNGAMALEANQGGELVVA